MLTIRENHLYKISKYICTVFLCKRISRNSLVNLFWKHRTWHFRRCLPRLRRCIWEIKRIQSRRHTQASRIDAPCERSSRHRALRNTRRWPAARSPSGTPLALDPGRQSQRREERTSGRASHQLSLIGLIRGGEVKGHRQTVSGELEEGLYLHLRPPAILVWRQTLSSPDAQRHSSLPAQSSQSHKVDLWSWIITPLHNGEVGKTKMLQHHRHTFFFF